MPTITLSDAYDAKLKVLAASDPFQPREYWVEQLIEDAIARNGITLNTNDHSSADGDAIRLESDSRQLAHTKLISATVDGRVLLHPDWNTLMKHIHVKAHQRLGSYDAIRKASTANLRQGRYEQDGYKYLPEADFSIQGSSALEAWKRSLSLAKAMDIEISAAFEWRDKEGAAYPGKRGFIKWSPKGD